MARRLMKLMTTRTKLLVLMLTTISITSSGCVSTEELYAEYDESLCQLVPEQTPDGVLMLREKISNSLFHWEPAVYFGFDEHSLSEQSEQQLRSALPVLKAYPYLLLSLQGFTDSIGSVGYNRALANRRVTAVSTFLASEGINKDRLVIQTLGEGLKTVGINNEAARALNRRVELMLLDSKGKPISLSVDPESILLRYLKNNQLESAAGQTHLPSSPVLTPNQGTHGLVPTGTAVGVQPNSVRSGQPKPTDALPIVDVK